MKGKEGRRRGEGRERGGRKKRKRQRHRRILFFFPFVRSNENLSELTDRGDSRDDLSVGRARLEKVEIENGKA